MLRHIKSKFHQASTGGGDFNGGGCRFDSNGCLRRLLAVCHCSWFLDAKGSVVAPLHQGLAIELRYAPPSELPGVGMFRLLSVLTRRLGSSESASDAALICSRLPHGLGGAVMTRLARICRDSPECGESARLLQWPLLLPVDVCFFHVQECGTNGITLCTSPATEAARKRLHFQSVMLGPETKCYGASWSKTDVTNHCCQKIVTCFVPLYTVSMCRKKESEKVQFDTHEDNPGADTGTDWHVFQHKLSGPFGGSLWHVSLPVLCERPLGTYFDTFLQHALQFRNAKKRLFKRTAS